MCLCIKEDPDNKKVTPESQASNQNEQQIMRSEERSRMFEKKTRISS